MNENEEKKITLKISDRTMGHLTVELPPTEARNRIVKELGAGKWLDVHPGADNRYPVMDPQTFVDNEAQIMGDVFTAQSVVLMPGARGG